MMEQNNPQNPLNSGAASVPPAPAPTPAPQSSPATPVNPTFGVPLSAAQQPPATPVPPAPIQATSAQPAPQPINNVPTPAPVPTPAVPQNQPIQTQAQSLNSSSQSSPLPAPRPNMNQPNPNQRPGQVMRPGTIRKPMNPRRLIIGCLGCSGLAIFLFVLLVFIFVAQTSATGENPIARSLGVNTASFINTLILLVNLIFGAFTIGLFLASTAGLFRIFLARKDDQVARKNGMTLAGVSLLLMLVVVFIWVGTYFFLSSKRVAVPKTTTSAIVTVPESTLGLTAPIEVKFSSENLPINTRTYDVLSYLWNFGDGVTSTVASPSNMYEDKGSNNGRYDVTLLVTKRNKQTNEESVDTYTTVVTIANVEINASFSVQPENGPAPLDVSFDASSSTAPAGQIVTYEWDFNNDNVFNDATGVTTTHTFEQVGKYTVGLRVTDNTGQYKIKTLEINVTDAEIPVAVINVPTTDGKYYTGSSYNFDASASTSPNGTVQLYEWDFGDGTAKANTRTATHVFRNPGEYKVLLTVTDDNKVSSQSTKTLKVENKEAAPLAAITTIPAPEKNANFIAGTAPFEVTFDGAKSQDSDNNIVDYKWDFDGDGKEDAAGKQVTYIYKISGSFNATLTVIDALGNEGQTTFPIKVGSQPLQARITAEPFEGVAPLTVTFDAGGSSYPNGQIVSYEWDFGDGSPKQVNTSKLVYKYTQIGSFTAKVTAIGSDNSRSTAEIPVNVRPVPLAACFEVTTEQGPAPLTVEFDPRCSTGSVAKYSWDFGNNSTSRTRKPTQTFDKPGSYQVTLEVSDNQNVIDTFTKTILVTGNI